MGKVFRMSLTVMLADTLLKVPEQGQWMGHLDGEVDLLP